MKPSSSAAERGHVLCIARAYPRHGITGLSDLTGGWIERKAYEAFAPVSASELIEAEEGRLSLPSFERRSMRLTAGCPRRCRRNSPTNTGARATAPGY